MAEPRHAHPDACPGVLAMHQAADGVLARVRLPGGRVRATQLHTLAECADELGDGVLYLTSRANVQLRGMPECAGELGARLGSAGLLPAPTHERVRNYLASPASGYFGGHVDVRPLLRALDAAVCSRDGLAGLSGRFLFALDDGRGDLVAEDADLGWHALAPHGDTEPGMLVVGGRDTGLRVGSAHAVEVLVRCAETFRAACEDGGSAAWRVADLAGSHELLTDAVRAAYAPHEARCRPLVAGERVAVGISAQTDTRRAVCAAPIFGELSTMQARLIANEAAEVIVTPWRTVLIPDIERDRADRVADELEDAGLGVDPATPWLGISACVGMPSCAKAHADVRGDAKALLSSLPAGTTAHFAGCDRRCGKPAGPHTDVLAGPEGYQVDGALVPTEALVESLIRDESGRA